MQGEKIRITWLGQGGFLLLAAGERIVIDPYLSDTLAARGLPRLFPAPVAAEALRPTRLLVTHDHADHFDEATLSPLLAASPATEVIGPLSVGRHCLRMGLPADRYRRLDAGDSFRERNFGIRAVKARHTDPYSVGFLLRLAGRTVYISGDTLYDPALAEDVLRAAESPVDTAILCINGKLGNMDAAGALRVAEALAPRRVIPMHYGLFADNTADPEPFAAAVRAAGRECLLLTPGVAAEI